MSLRFFSRLFYFSCLSMAKFTKQAIPMPSPFKEWPCSY